MNRTPSHLLGSLVCLLFCQTGSAQSLVQNGDFSKWEGNVPSNWTIETGARSGNGAAKSRIAKGSDGSLELSGNSTTNNWLFVSQTFEVKPGEMYSAHFEAVTKNVRREDGQRDNCYVGVLLKDKQGRVVRFEVSNVSAKSYTGYQRLVTIPRTGASAVVAVFLSKSGTLGVRKAEFEKVGPEDSFAILVSEMDRNYSYFDHKKIDWKRLTKKYESRANAVASEPEKFANVIREMLSELRDTHVWLDLSGKRIGTHSKKWNANYDFGVVDKTLGSVKRFGNLGLIAKTKDGFGYIRVNSLYNIKLELLNDMVEAIEKLFDSPGIIVDIRRNSGGSEFNAQLIASLFVSERVVYAMQSRRTGPRHTDLEVTSKRVIAPPKIKNYRKPIVCMFGPGAVSSGEGMAMMFRAIKSCTTVGQPTRGSSGNPLPVTLPNKVVVWYSRWVSMMPDGTVIEDRGVKPEIIVKHVQGSDPTFTKAVEILKEKTK